MTSNTWNRMPRVGGVMLVVLIVTSAVVARRVVAPNDEVRLTLSQSIIGLVHPSDVSSITLPTSASIAEVLVGVGDELAVDQTIARLDQADSQRDLAQLAVDVERARHDVAERERSIARARQTMEPQQGNDPAAQLALAEREAQQVPMRQARDSPERARAAFELALLRVHRLEQLAAAGLVAKQDVEEAQATYRVAADDFSNALRAAESTDRLVAAEEAQTRARRRLSVADQQKQLAELQAGLQQARLALTQTQMRHEAARSRTGDSFVRAARAGTVVELPIHAGDRLTTGALIAKIAALDPMTIDIDVDPLVVNTLKVGGPARVNVASIHLVNQPARIRSIGPLPVENGKYPVQLILPNPARARLAGQTADVTLGEPAARR